MWCYLYEHNGPLLLVGDWYSLIEEKLNDCLRKSGLGDAIDKPESPPKRLDPPQIPSMNFTGSLEFILNAPISADIIEVVCKELYDVYIRPFFKNLQECTKLNTTRAGLKSGSSLLFIINTTI
jgi:hypothetical protein